MGFLVVSALFALAGLLLKRERLGKLSRTLFILAITSLVIAAIV